MPSRIFRSSISPFHDTLSCVCDLLFSALSFLLQLLVEPRFQNAFLYTTIHRGEKLALPSQRGVPCISDEPVSVALLNCENLSLVDLLCSSLPAVGHALLCLLLAMLFFRLYLWAVLQVAMPTLCFSCATGCSLLPARVIRACFLLTRIRSSG